MSGRESAHGSLFPNALFFFTVVPIVRLAWTTQTSCDKKGHNMRNSKQKKSPSLWLGMLFVDPRNALSTTGSAVLSFLAPCLHCEHMSAHISAHMSAHISMHMSAHTHVCTHVYTHVCTRVCANVRTHVLAHVRTHVLAHVRIHALAHVCTHHACTQHACTYFLHVCLHTCLHTSLAYMPGQICYTHVCTHVCTHLLRACLCTCPYTCPRTCLQTCLHMCSHTEPHVYIASAHVSNTHTATCMSMYMSAQSLGGGRGPDTPPILSNAIQPPVQARACVHACACFCKGRPISIPHMGAKKCRRINRFVSGHVY